MGLRRRRILRQQCMCAPIFISAPRINSHTHMLSLLGFSHILRHKETSYTSHIYARLLYSTHASVRKTCRLLPGSRCNQRFFLFSLGFLHVRCRWCVFKSIRKLAAGVTTRQEQLPAAAFRLITKQEDEREELNLAKLVKLAGHMQVSQLYPHRCGMSLLLNNALESKPFA